MTDDDLMIDVRDLRKRFFTPEPVDAVAGVSFSCRRGEVFSLLGPNGAGKTTTLRMLSTLLQPDEGTATLNGHEVRQDPASVRRSIGYLSTTTGLYKRLTAREMIRYVADLQGVAEPEARTEALLDQFNIRDFADQRCDRLSTGMAQKVNIARAIVHEPPILILDEPTNGLDVLVAREFLEFIERARDEGYCLLFSTHIMADVERLADRVAIMHRGRVLASDTLDGLREQTGEQWLGDIFARLVADADAQRGEGT